VPGVLVFHAGVEERNGLPVTAGGRVLGVTAVDAGGDIARAVSSAYLAAGKISFAGVHYRSDIAARALHLQPGTRESR
jgi:phosphoribosylamine--glycine ligase